METRDPELELCDLCANLRAHGRNTGDPIHCRDCHQTWTGNEAQHCLRCHRTFTNITAADRHRYRKLPDGRIEERCTDPSATPDWRQKRPGVWTDAPQATEYEVKRMRGMSNQA